MMLYDTIIQIDNPPSPGLPPSLQAIADRSADDLQKIIW